MAPKSQPMDPLEKIIRPIVEGQIRGFLKEHPSILEAVDWYKPRRHDKATTFTNSLSKRIVRDLICSKSRGRLAKALAGIVPGTPSCSAVDAATAAEAPGLEESTEPGVAAFPHPVEPPK